MIFSIERVVGQRIRHIKIFKTCQVCGQNFKTKSFQNKCISRILFPFVCSIFPSRTIYIYIPTLPCIGLSVSLPPTHVFSSDPQKPYNILKLLLQIKPLTALLKSLLYYENSLGMWCVNLKMVLKSFAILVRSQRD